MADQPPSSNTGVPTPTPTPTYSIVLDWFAAHVEHDAVSLVPSLAAELGCQYRIGRPVNGYSHCADLVSGEDLWAKVCYEQRGTPWVLATGASSQSVENAIRRLRQAYRVTRKDAALDLYDAEWFPILVDVMRKHAHQAFTPLKIVYHGDWEYARKGRTMELGSRQSRSMIRLYEKGRKERADPNWIRCEVQYNPQDEVEARAAAEMSAAQIWTLRAYPVVGKWIGIEPSELFEYQADTTRTRPKRDQERARHAICDQYGKTIQAWLRDCDGDPVAFCAELLAGIEHQKKVRAQKNAPASVSVAAIVQEVNAC